MIWTGVKSRLDTHYASVVDRVRAHYPQIGAAISSTPVGFAKFIGHLYFIYDARTQRYEDLIFELICAPTKRTFVADGSDLDEGPDLLCFEVSRGGGQVLFGLDRIALPADEDSPEYEHAVFAYLDWALGAIEDHMDLIVETLKTPYDIEQ